MADFGIRFFLSNLFICVMTGLLLMAKRALRNYLTNRMQFHLWFLLLILLVIPFMPFRPIEPSQLFLWFGTLKNTVSSTMDTFTETAANTNVQDITKQMDDFALSVSSAAPSIAGFILCWIWLIGVLIMLLFVIKSKARLISIQKSALPLQNKEVHILYCNCLREMKIKRNLPVYSTAFLKSPVIVGLFRPRIYLPIHLISDFNAADMRYMLLHELQHYKHKDALATYLMNLIGILYWFNPLVWYALKEMRNDREVACDTSVLELLEESDYADYGNTLLNFAKKVSLIPFPFAAGISGSMKQMRKRILNISTYKKPSIGRKLKGLTAFVIIAVILLGFTPMLSTYAAEQDRYKWSISPEKISMIDLSAYFSGYEGSFVLYDLKNDAWSIYDMEYATLRTAPNSTYKIYAALFGLEEGIITPDDSFMTWSGEKYPFEAWNADQDLHSAMSASVNWYFQEIDKRLGASVLKNYIRKIGYGNENLNSDLSTFWMQSTLKISPVEQVELLTDLYNNNFGFLPENINAVKDSICLFPVGFFSAENFSERNLSADDANFYGKTGTGRVDGQDVNGWFIGFVETKSNTYFFAANIQGDANAAGSNAAEITEAILDGLDIWG